MRPARAEPLAQLTQQARQLRSLVAQGRQAAALAGAGGGCCLAGPLAGCGPLAAACPQLLKILQHRQGQAASPSFGHTVGSTPRPARRRSATSCVTTPCPTQRPPTSAPRLSVVFLGGLRKPCLGAPHAFSSLHSLPTTRTGVECFLVQDGGCLTSTTRGALQVTDLSLWNVQAPPLMESVSSWPCGGHGGGGGQCGGGSSAGTGRRVRGVGASGRVQAAEAAGVCCQLCVLLAKRQRLPCRRWASARPTQCAGGCR